MAEERDYTLMFSMSGSIKVSAGSLQEARAIAETLLEESPNHSIATIELVVKDITTTLLQEEAHTPTGIEFTDTIRMKEGNHLPYCRKHQADLTSKGIGFVVLVENTSAACILCQALEVLE